MVVMPTRGGKSLAFILPAAYTTGGLIVVVVPLLSLQQDFIRRYKELGLRYAT